MKRIDKETRRALYELPGFRAGLAISLASEGRALIQATACRCPQIQRIDWLLSEIIKEAESWQRYALMNYDQIYKLVEEEKA